MKSKTNNLNADLQDFFINIKKAVNDTGITPYAWAKKIGLGKQAISNFLRADHDPKFSTVLRIVKGIQISMDELIGYSSIKTPNSPSPVSDNEPEFENIDLVRKVSKMHENDVELLEAIIKVLDERRARAVARLVHAVNDEKDSFIMKNSEKERSLPNSEQDVDDDFEDEEEVEEDDDFDDEDEDGFFEEDDDFDSDEDDYEEEYDDFYDE